MFKRPKRGRGKIQRVEKQESGWGETESNRGERQRASVSGEIGMTLFDEQKDTIPMTKQNKKLVNRASQQRCNHIEV